MTDIPDADTLKGPDRVWLDWPGANRGEIVYDEPPERDTQPGQIGYVRADLHTALAARVIEQDARIARLKAALALLTDRSAGLVHAHHHGSGLEGWYDKVDGVDRAITAARAALEDGQ